MSTLATSPRPAQAAPDRPERLERQARRRAGAKLGWYIHASAYLLVNLGLAALALSQGRHWALYPALGWGLGLAIHGAVVWLALPGSGWHGRLVERERQALQAAQARQPRHGR